MANKKPLVTAVLTEQFYNCFVPEVETYETKVLLTVDNAPSHLHLKQPNVQVVFFLFNTVGIIQLLDQGIIATLKKCYIKHTFQFTLDKLEN